jgi:hypothetical protein
MGRRDHPSSAADPKLCASIPGAGSCVGRNWARCRRVFVLMTRKRTTNRSAPRRIVALLAFAGLCAGLTAAIGISTAGASKATVIGKTKDNPPPSCGDKKQPAACNVVGRVTGYMKVADGEKHPFNVFQNGKIVAWSIDLSKPLQTKKYPQLDFVGTLFENKTFGKNPSARLAVLKRKQKHKFKLIRQSKPIDLSSFMGSKQTFTLQKPLHVRKGQVVALTYPTWASNFVYQNISTDGNQWRASRTGSHCGPKHPNNPKSVHRFARKSHAQQKVGSTRPYECNYSKGRLLYWAYFVPGKKK